MQAIHQKFDNPGDTINILAISDICGRNGRTAVFSLLEKLKERYHIDLTIANAENAAGGLGCTTEIAKQLLSEIDVLTMGNHVWDKKDLVDFIRQEPRIVRPANYPPGTPGEGFYLLSKKEVKIGIVNLSGRIFMEPLDCPFQAVEKILPELQKEASIIIVDFHAEATSEKIAMGYFLDGRVSAVYGTHTHVPTADLKFLPQGTLYITDIGMTGPHDSVIGMKKELVLQRFLTGMPVRFEAAKGDAVLQGLIIKIAKNGKAVSGELLLETFGIKEGE